MIALPKRYIIALIIGTVISGVAVILYQSMDTYNQLDERYVQLKTGKAEEIVLINLGNADRAAIAQTISRIGQCEPRLLVIDFLFREFNGDAADSALLRAIDKHRVLLPSKNGGQGTFGIDQNFQQAAADVGFTDIGISKDGRNLVTDVNLYYDLNGRRDYHLAHKIVSRIDPVAAHNFDMTVKNPIVDVVITRLSSQFETLDYRDELICDILKDKLVIAGYLGPGDEDKFRTYATYRDDVEGSGKDMYGPVVLANQVLMVMGR